MINLANFANLFPFKTNTATSPVNSLLDSEDVTLERLLDEESFVNEFKIQNPKLVQFLKYDKYKTLVEFVTVVGPEEDNKRACKYPFVACQVLTTQINAPAQFFLPEKDLTLEYEIKETIDVEEQFQQPVEPVQKEQASVIIDKIQSFQLPKLDNPSEQSTQEVKTAEEKDQTAEGSTPEKKTRLVKRIVQKQVAKKIKKVVPPLINDLFSYTQGEVNYTLAGYVARILNVLFAKKSNSLTNYFFSQRKFIKIIDHIQSRSIAEIIIKFLTIDNLLFINERQELLTLLLERLSKSSEINLMGNLSFVLCDVIDKFSSTIKTVNGSKELLVHIYSPQFCQRLVNNVICETSECIANYNTPILLSSLTSIRNLMENKEQTKNAELNEKYQETMHFIKNNLAESSQLTELFKNFFYKALDRLNITRAQSETLGFGRSKLVEVLFYLIKFDFFNIQAIVPESKYFERLFNLVKEYELNNVLHNQIIKILTFVLELEQGSPIVTSLIEKGNILNFIYEQVVQDERIVADIKSKKRGIYRKGYIGHIVKLGQLLLKVSATNNQVTALFSDDKWAVIKQFIDRETYENEKTLAGFITRRSDVSNISFHKEDILALHHTFLMQAPVTTYPQVVQEPKQDQIEQTIRMFEQNLVIRHQPIKQVEEKKEQIVITNQQKQEEQKIKEEIKHKVQQQVMEEIEEGMQIYSNAKYWKESKSLKFEVEDLMNDL